MGVIEIMPQALPPGVSYQVEAWHGNYDLRLGRSRFDRVKGGSPPTLSLERLTYRLSGGEARGVLEFSTPEGLGDVVSDVESKTREVGDAV